MSEELVPEGLLERALSTEQGAKAARERLMEELGRAMGTYAAVKDMPQHPGWPTFIEELQKRAKYERETMEGIMDAMFLHRTSNLEFDFTESRIRLLVLEMCLKLYLDMREKAFEAKDILDSLPAKVRDSEQNG